MNRVGSWFVSRFKRNRKLTLGNSVGQTSFLGDLALHGVGDSVDRQVGDLPHAPST